MTLLYLSVDSSIGARYFLMFPFPACKSQSFQLSTKTHTRAPNDQGLVSIITETPTAAFIVKRMAAIHHALNDDHMSEEGEFEIQDLNDDDDDDNHDGAASERGLRRSRSMGRRAAAARSSGGASVSSTSTARSKSNSRSRSSSVGRMSHRQRSRAMMASPSKYGRGLRRDKESDLDAQSTATTVTDDLSEEPSPPLPDGDNDSNRQLRRRLSEMSVMASTTSPSVYRQKKLAMKKRMSNESMESFSNLTMSPCDPGSQKVVDAARDDMPKMTGLLDKESDIPSIHSKSIDRQQRKEQAALEEVMSMVAKSKKLSRKSSRLDSSTHSTTSSSRTLLDGSSHSIRSASKSGIPPEMMMMMAEQQSPVRRTQSLNANQRPSRRSIKSSESFSQKKERRDKVKNNLGMFVEDD